MTKNDMLLFIISHYNHLPMLSVNFKMPQTDLKGYSYHNLLANFTAINQIYH